MEQKTKHNILVVDDEAPNLNALKRLFWRDYTVFAATSGEEGLKLIEGNEIALIITDQRMPGMSGVEMLDRTIEEYPNTIRIILTAYTDVEDLIEAINTGRVYRYVTKPWNPEEMKITVKRALESYELRGCFKSPVSTEKPGILRHPSSTSGQSQNSRDSWDNVICVIISKA